MRHAPLLVLLAVPLAAQPAGPLELLLDLLPASSRKITGRITPQDKTWEDWVRRTGERPPDFDRLPGNAFLPDPLVQHDGRRVNTNIDWAARKAWIRAQYEQWVFGKMPPAPGNVRATITGERREDRVTVRDVRLEFGPGQKAVLRVQVMIPDGPSPKPVFLTNHPRTRPWVAHAVRRGYIGCIYFAADPIYGNEDDSDKFLELYPEYDWSCLARWAWSAMRAVDYLLTVPEADPKRIAITGHSRNGKQALLAAAFDERIAAVALSSGNTGEGNPWRYTTDAFQNESIEQITGNFPHWFHPRLRFFVGREHKLPVDQNLLMSLVAPRGLLLASAYPEGQGAPFGFEQAYRGVREVYRWFGAEDKVGLSLRDGEHATTAEDIEQYVDFFDSVFGRRRFPKPETFVLGYDFARWRELSGETAGAAPELSGKEPRDRVRWALGEEPPALVFPARRELTGQSRTSDGWLADLYRRPLRLDGTASTALSFGDDLKADFYYPEAAQGKMPVVVWLHPYSYATGYSRYAAAPITSLTRRGFAVLAFDQAGFGTRIHQAARFYERYPRWSLLGKMVADTRAAVAAVAALDRVDASRIYLMGWSLGGKVALWTAALAPEVSGVAVMGAFSPLRLDRPEKQTEGVRHYSHLHGLVPRFGFYVDAPERLPADYEDVLALLAPRPALVVAPELDRYHPVEDVRQGVETARRAYAAAGKPDALRLETPRDFQRFSRSTQERMVAWLAETAKR